MIDDRLPYFHCFPSKLLGALAQLPPDQKLTYLIVLLRIYEVRGPCPDSVEALATRIGINKKRVSDALDSLIKCGKLTREDDAIMNPFARDVLVYGNGLHERRQVAGSEGGRRSAEKRKSKQSPTPSNAAAPAEHKEQHQEEDSLFPNGNSPPASDWPADYREQFWASYPRKTEKKAAIAKLDAVKKSCKVRWAVFLAGVLRHRQHVAGTEERYIKHPTTWLNRGCWEDEYGAPRRVGDGPPQRPAGGGSGFAAVFRELRDLPDEERHDDDSSREPDLCLPPPTHS